MAAPESAPAPDTTAAVSFAAHIRPLFREMDIAEMTFLLDLTDLDDVREYADAIHERVANGSMPCDAPWPPENVTLFRSWVDGGCLP
ncbi:hypothetical protein [Actinokineospora enzanensis]|uniref:hypothetical protein n=1 Tax=Actinokineospora enzanensis TaxID=155975 RepID=UPI00037B412C|nr:hypothetical protein [Actinokineospora enzanensis]